MSTQDESLERTRAEIKKLNAEREKLQAEAGKMRAEREKHYEESWKLGAERLKLANEAMKFEREHKWYPLVVMAGCVAAGAALMGASITFTKFLLGA